MDNINKTWYIWSDEIYNGTWQMGLYISQTGRLKSNSSSLNIRGLMRNVSDTPQSLGNRATFTVDVDGKSYETNTDIIHIGDINPGDYVDTFNAIYISEVNHDMYGEKTITIKSQLKPTYPTIQLTFDTLLILETINSSNLAFTEIKDIDKEALNTGYATIKTKIIVKSDPNHTEEIVLTEEDSIKSWEYTDDRYVPDNGFIGQFVARTLDGELQNIASDFNIENREIELRFGIVQMGSDKENLVSEDGLILTTESNTKVVSRTFGDDIITWYSLGNFLITKPEDDNVNDNTKYEAFDYTVKFNIPFDADWKKFGTEPSFNETINSGEYFTSLELAQYVCDQVGVELATTKFTNNNFPIDSNQFTEGNSCRDVMKAISQLAHGWCRIGWDNKLYIDELVLDTENISEYNTISNDHYYSLTTQKELYGPINRVVVGMEGIDGESFYVEDANSIEENGLHELYIYDNPITYTDELRKLSLNYASKLFGFSYLPFETETPGHPWVKANEPIKLISMNGTPIVTYPFKLIINYNGHIKTKLSGDAITEQEKTTAYNRNIYKELKNVKIQVDKQKGEILLMNSTTVKKGDLTEIENSVKQIITDTYSKTQVQEIISGTSPDGTVVSSVKTTSGIFDKDGLTIEQEGRTDTKTNINSNGMIIYNKNSSTDDPLLTVDSDGVIAKNVKVKTYLNIGSHSRIENYIHTDGSVGTGVFWIGSDF